MSVLDAVARRKMASAIRAYASGQITNFEFETRIPASNDKAVHAAEDYLWALYDDFKEHYAAGSHALDKTTKAEIARLVLFLHSELPFDWQRRPIKPSFIENSLSFGASLKRWRSKMQSFFNQGDLSVWPFLDRNQLRIEAEKARTGMI